MDRPWMRNAAISCAIACGAMVAGPGVIGSAVASADGLFGIDIDILDIFGGDDDKKSNNHVRVGAGRGGTPNAATNQVGDVGQPRVGAGRGGTPNAATNQVGDVGQPQLGGVISGSGGGAVPQSGGVGRPSTLPPVSTEPSTRTVVIRAEPPASAPVAPAVPAPVIVPPVVAPMPVVPVAPAPSPVAPAAPTAAAPTIDQPRTHPQPALPDARTPPAIPLSFRAGYADYLRVADASDLLAVALPGVAGILAFTAAGGLVGYRQARAAHALPPAGIARFLQ